MNQQSFLTPGQEPVTCPICGGKDFSLRQDDFAFLEKSDAVNALSIYLNLCTLSCGILTWLTRRANDRIMTIFLCVFACFLALPVSWSIICAQIANRHLRYNVDVYPLQCDHCRFRVSVPRPRLPVSDPGEASDAEAIPAGQADDRDALTPPDSDTPAGP